MTSTQVKQAMDAVNSKIMQAANKSMQVAIPAEAKQLSFDDTETNTVSYAEAYSGSTLGTFVISGTAEAVDRQYDLLKASAAATIAEALSQALGGTK